MRVVITGASGYIGYNLTRALSESSNEILHIYHNDPIHLPGNKSISVDLSNIVTRSMNLSDYDVIIHLAWDYHNNKASIDMTKNIVNIGVKYEIPLIFSSSCSVYGHKGGYFDEETTPSPSTAYGKSKLTSEKLIENRYNEAGLQYFIIRYSTIYGKNASVIKKWADLLNMPMIIDRYINIIHINDVIELNKDLLEITGKGIKGIFNFAYPKSVLLSNILSIISKIKNVKVPKFEQTKGVYKIGIDKIKKIAKIPSIDPIKGIYMSYGVEHENT